MQAPEIKNIEQNQWVKGPKLRETGIIWPDGQTIKDPNLPSDDSTTRFGYVRYPNSNTNSPSWGMNSAYVNNYPDSDKTADLLYSISIPVNANIQKVGDTIDVDAVLLDRGRNQISGKLTLTYNGYTISSNGHKVYAFTLTDPDEKNSEEFNSLYSQFQQGSYNDNTKTIPDRIIGIADDPNYDFLHGNVVSENHLSQPQGTLAPNETIHCFLSGTLIKMKDECKAVEDIQIGDYVQAFVDDSFVQRKVIAINKSLIIVHNADYYPICIKKHAFAKNVPSQDLYVTSEHCLYINKAFIPVRMLVNGRSIIWDRKDTSYYVYHIETEEHSIIESNGLLSESYLDTDLKKRKVAQKSWEKDAAAPLRVDQAFVEPIYNQLKVRSNRLKLPFVGNKYKITNKANFHILTDQEGIIYPFAINKDRYLFNILVNTSTIYLSSRAGRPYDVKGPFVDDRRYLGVLIGEIYCISQSSKKLVDIHLKNEKLQGWNNFEPSPYRWTNGQALLPLQDVIREKSILVVQVVDTSLYVDDNKEDDSHQISA